MPFDYPFRTYVIDTSVLLSDPHAILRFDEHEVVIPAIVITELEGKRTHPELGYFARTALRLLDDLRVEAGRLDEPVPLESGGTLRVELNHADPSILPSGFQIGDNDTRILAVARNLAAEGHHVVVVSKDLPLRVKASAVGLVAEEAHVATHGPAVADEVVAEDHRGARRHRGQAGADPQQGGLARAVRALQHDGLAPRHVEVDAGERGEAPEQGDRGTEVDDGLHGTDRRVRRRCSPQQAQVGWFWTEGPAQTDSGPSALPAGAPVSVASDRGQ